LPGGALAASWDRCTPQPAATGCGKYSSPADAAGAWMYCYNALPLDEHGRLRTKGGESVRRKVSPGLVALAPGALLDVPLDTRLSAEASNASAAVRVAVEYLTSYEGHGVVRARCARGCRCDEATVDAHVPRAEPADGSAAAASNASGAPNASTFLSFELAVTGASADCALQLLVLKETSSGRHKFKVRYVNVWSSEEAGHPAGVTRRRRLRAAEAHTAAAENS
jgi:hypothetical protein